MGNIYKITHTDGRVYIGQTTLTINQRWQQHQEAAKYRKRYYSHFLAAIHKYGIECWTIEVLEQVSDDQLNNREIYWIAFYDATNPAKGFNIDAGGNKPPNQKGKKRSEETRKKISESKKGIIWGHHSEATKQHLSQLKVGIPLREEHKQALAEAWKTRPPRKPEQSEKASKTSRGRINIKVYKVISPEGVEYTTDRGMNDFCREHELYITGMNKVANGKQSDWHGWKVLPPWEAN